MSTYWLLVFVWFSPITGEMNLVEFSNNADGNMYQSYDECIADAQVVKADAVNIDPNSLAVYECYSVEVYD